MILDLVNLEVASLTEPPHLCHDTVHLVLVGLYVTLYQLQGGEEGRKRKRKEEGGGRREEGGERREGGREGGRERERGEGEGKSKQRDKDQLCSPQNPY